MTRLRNVNRFYAEGVRWLHDILFSVLFCVPAALAVGLDRWYSSRAIRRTFPADH